MTPEKLRRWAPLSLAVFGSATILACQAPAGFSPVTSQGEDIVGLFTLEMVLSVVVFALIAGLLAYCFFRFRSRGEEGEPEQVHGNTRLEITWTVGAALLVCFLAGSGIVTMSKVLAAPADAPHIQVIGHQWWWEYRYPDQHISTADELHLPAGQMVVLDITGADVIHSFWMPQFGWKRDAIPNHVNPMPALVSQPGTYDGACAEYCGTQHAWMRIRVIADSPQDYQAWLTAQQQPPKQPTDAAGQHGQQVFLQSTCVSCHNVAGTTAQGTVGPDLTHFGSRSTIGSGVLTNTPDNLARWIKDAQSVKPGSLMPPFRSLSDQDAQAIAAYLEELK